MPQPSPSAASIAASGIREIVNLVLQRPDDDIARLEIGEPDSRPPAHVLDAARAAIAGPIGYTSSGGSIALRSVLADRFERIDGVRPSTESIVVGQGAVEVIAASLAAVVRPGDEVLIPDPSWPNYEAQARLLGARPVFYPLRRELGYLPDPDEVIALMGEDTRAIVVNSPSNPAGSVIDADRLRRIVEAAAERDVLVISDEVYDEIVFDGEHVRASPFAPEHVVTVHSFSKTYSMTGWRVGYARIPDAMQVTMERVQETLLSCVSTLTQAAAIAAIVGPQDAIAENLERYRRRRDLAVGLLRDGGVEVSVPAGAFYLLVPLGDGVDSRAAALELVDHGVAVAPGSAFGRVAADTVRLSLASADDVLATGIERFLAWRSGRPLVAARVCA